MLRSFPAEGSYCASSFCRGRVGRGGVGEERTHLAEALVLKELIQKLKMFTSKVHEGYKRTVLLSCPKTVSLYFPETHYLETSIAKWPRVFTPLSLYFFI
jgi:hypothetical protein